MSDDEKVGDGHSALEELADWFRTYEAGYEATKEGLSTSHHAVLRFGEDAPVRVDQFGTALRPDLDVFIGELKEAISGSGEVSTSDGPAALGSSDPFSREWYERKIIAVREMFDAMASGARTDDQLLGVKLAFHIGTELGALIKEYEWKFGHEKAALEGHRHMEGREAGQPLAAKARRKTGDKRKRAVIAAASRLIAENRALVRNVSELARVIEAEKLEELRMKDGTFLSESRIREYLTKARKDGQFD